MDSQQAVVLTRGGSDDGSVGQSLKSSGTVPNILEEPVDLSLLLSCPLACNLQSCALKQMYLQSNSFKTKQVGGAGEVPDVSLTSQPALWETGDIRRLNRSITLQTGLPGMCKQPVTITLDVPGLCDRQMTDSAALSITKDVPHLNSSLKPRTVSLETSSNGLTSTPVTAEGELGDQSTEAMDHSEESLHRTKAGDGKGIGEGDGTKIRNGCPLLLQMPLICFTAKEEGPGGTEGGDQGVAPPLQPPSRCHGGTGQPAEEGEEQRADAENGRGERKQEVQGVVLDLSLPKKRESKDRRLWHESMLLMEVDEVEGDGDRDVVEEDDDEEYDSALRTDGADILDGPLLSPSFGSTSMFPVLSSLDSCEGLLLIDDQGIPYTLSPEGHKVPQIDLLELASPQPGQSLVPSSSAEVSSVMATAGVSQHSQSLVTPPTHDDNWCPAPQTSNDPLPNDGHMKNMEALVTTEQSQNAETCKVLGSDVEAICEARVMGSVLRHQPTRPTQILPSSSLQLSTPLAKTDTNPGLAFSLPLSLIQNSPGASTSMFLLLSTSTSSSSQSFSTSTPIALIDPSTGQLTQITASSLSSLSLSSPLPTSASPGQVVTSKSSIPATLSQPVIRVPADNPVTILSRVKPSMNPVTPRTVEQPVAEESFSPVSSPLIKQSEPSSSELDPDHQSLSTEEKRMAPTSNGSSPTNDSILTRPQSPSLTFDPSIEIVNQSNALESECTSLLWNDHLYFSSIAPRSPPLVTIAPSGRPRNLEPLDPLDLVSPASPPSSGPRRVLYCPLCPRIFYYLSDLERHSITHSQNKPHVCLQCGKAFKRSSHLQRHNHIHTGQRNFVCPICSKRFREAGELQRHQRVHTGEKPYQCSLCHTRFAERNTLRRHTKRKHPYHQAAVDMLTEGGDGRAGGEGEEETEEWYSSTVSNLENSDSEPDSEVTS